jgi:hypothetical protein
MSYSYSRIPLEVIALVAQYLATVKTFKVGKGLSVIIRDTASVGFTVNGTKVAGLKGNKRYNRPDAPERKAFYEAFNAAKGIAPATKATAKSGKRTFKNDAEKMAHVRSCRKSSGKGQAAPATTPQASGKLSADDKLKMVADALAALTAALAS